MKITVSAAARTAITPLREIYRRQLDCQIVHDCAHDRENCVEWHLLSVNEEVAGYGCIWSGPYWMDKGSLFEFFVLPEFRTALFPLFESLLAAAKPTRIYAQTNDPFLGVLIFDYVERIAVGHIVFKDDRETELLVEGAVFRQVVPDEISRIFEHKVEPVGDWALDLDGRIIATGGIGYHYNPPYGDIFMEVHPEFRQRGCGSFLVQELKKVCRRAGKIPAARCRPQNIAFRRTLERAGFAPCARLLWGDAVSKTL